MKHSAYDRAGRRKYLNASESQRFMEAVECLPSDRRAFCKTAYYTGCRISEILSLTGSGIDIDSNILIFRSLKKRNRVEHRRIPIPSTLTEALVALTPENALDRIWGFHRTTAWRFIKRAMLEADICGIHATTKGMRHGFGVRSAMNSIPLNVIQSWMGHSDSATTAIYLDVQDEERRDLMMRTW